MLSVALKFEEMRGRNWLSLAPRAEDAETKNRLFWEPLENGIYLLHKRLFASLCTRRLLQKRCCLAWHRRRGMPALELRSYLGDAPARARAYQPVLC